MHLISAVVLGMTFAVAANAGARGGFSPRAQELSAAECYGVSLLAPFAGDVRAPALDQGFIAGERDTVPVLWTYGIETQLDTSLPAAGHHPAAVVAWGSTPILGGWIDMPPSVPGDPTTKAGALWFGGLGKETLLFATNAFGLTMTESAVLGAGVGTANQVQLVGYFTDSSGIDHAVLWDSVLPGHAPDPQALVGGSRALATFHGTTVGYAAISPDRPRLWTGLDPAALEVPDPSNFRGGRAVAIGSKWVGGYQEDAARVVRHAVVWNTDGAIPRDIHPEGFASSEVTATRGDIIAGVATDTNGVTHAVLWTSDQIQDPADLNPVIEGNPMVFGLTGALRPTAVGDDGSIAFGFDAGMAGYKSVLAIPGAPGGRELALVKPGKTNLTVSAPLTASCADADVYFAAYQNGLLVATSSKQSVPKGSAVVSVTNVITGLSPLSTYAVQWVAEGGATHFGTSVLISTQATNLPPNGTTNITFVAGQPLTLFVSDLLAAAVDPEGDPVSIGGLDTIAMTMYGGMISYILGTDFITYTPPVSGNIDILYIPIMDIYGAQGTLVVHFTGAVPPPYLDIFTDPAAAKLIVQVSGAANTIFQLQSAGSLTGPLVWTDLGPVTSDASGLGRYTLDTPLTGALLFRALTP